MKTLILISSLILSSLSFASIWFPANVTLDHTPERIMALIKNDLDQEIICKGTVQGFTDSGNVVEENVSETIAAGEYGMVHLWAVVYSARFVGSTSFIQCKTTDI